ncbi:hypothetical protein [Vreelandella profundi]|uniref:hypothetical protein n=1 Tax=Vreelandella profundi TaxID=2852117 RepID=UPI001F2DE52C|nr:hypothetical protein [Halomonas profundi]
MSVRSLGSLTLDMVLKTGNFLGPMDKASRSTKKQMKDISASIRQAATAVTATAAAAAAAGTALVAYTNNAAQNAREIKNQAAVASASVQEFQRMAYGVQSVGIEQDKLSDILKDVNDRIGDFMATGGGPMADFFENIAPKVGLTADAFRNLSGPQALQLYYDSLEKANLSQADLTFYLETMASDTTALIPLLRNGGDRLSDMADEADRLGIVMSDLEVAQLDEFAQQFDRASAAISGMSNAVASELAPYLSVAVDYLFDAADGADGFRDAMSGAVFESIAWLAQLVDEFLILDKNVQIATARMGAGFADFAEDAWGSISWLIDTALAGINNLIRGMNSIPGFTDLDLIGSSAGGSDWMQGFRDQAAEANAELSQLSIELFEMVNGAGPGARYLADVQEKIDQIRASVDRDGGVLSGLGGGTGGPSKAEQEASDERAKAAAKAADAINKQVAALEQQAAMLGMADDAAKLFELTQEGATETQLAAASAALETISAYEASEKSAEDYKKLLDDLRTTEEQLTDQLHERLAVLDAVTVASDEYAEAAGRIAAAAFVDAPEYAGLDATIGGPFGELDKIDEAEEKLQEWYSTQLEMLDDFRKERADLSAQWDEQERALHEEHQNELARIEKARMLTQLAGAESTFGDLAGLAAAFAGEQSGIYRALFATEKAFAVGKALMNVPSSFSKAFDATVGIPYVGPFLAPAAGAAAAAIQVGQAAAIGNIGMAHDGWDSLPATGSYWLEKGERVTTADTSAKMDNTLAQTDAMMARVESQMNRPGDNRGGNTTINMIEDASRAGQVEERIGQDGNRIIDVVVANIMSDGKAHKAMTSKYGLSTRAT